MQTVSRDIRTHRAGSNRRASISPDIKEAFRQVFVARQALAAKLAAQILTEGQPELHDDSKALCAHYRTRKGEIGGENANAQVHTHEVGIVIFDVRVRDLILLAPRRGETGHEVWLDDGEKVFPHDGGKYDQAGRVILRNILRGQ